MADPEVETSWSAVYPAAWVGTADYPDDVERLVDPEPAPVALVARNTYDDADGDDGELPPLRTLVIATPAGVDLSARIDDSLGTGETASSQLGSFSVSDTVSVELEASAEFPFSQSPQSAARAGVRCDAFDGRTLYGTATGWGEAVSYALQQLGAAGTSATIPLGGASGFAEGVLSVIAEGDEAEDPENEQARADARVFAEAVLVDGNGDAVTRSSVRVSEGFRGREAEMAGLPEFEAFSGSGWGPPAAWRTDAAGRSYAFVRDAQAAERFVQERRAPLPVRLEPRGIVGPTDAVVADLDPTGEPLTVACTVVGGRVSPVSGASVLQLATVASDVLL